MRRGAPYRPADRLARRLVPVALATILAGGVACRGVSSVFPGAPVVVIVVDTLRADHLPVYGYKGVETPNIDRLAKDSIVFDNAISHVPLTLPSHATLFTGLLPFENGVRDNLAYRLSKDRTTLASFLRGRGYATGGAISAVVLEKATGIGEGFDFYDDALEIKNLAEAMGHVQRSGGATEKLVEGWVEKQPPDKPLFAFLHLYEPHSPYEPPEPFKSRYASSPYDGEIATSDAIVGDFVRFLKGKGIYDRALLVFLSDHGESLGAHGEGEHGIFLYRDTTRIPLFVKLPGSVRAGSRVFVPAGIADVFPTVLSVLGEKPPGPLPGISLLALAQAPTARRIYSESLYPRLHFGWSELASLTDDRYQYIEAPKPELYDWKADPAEANNLAGGLPPAFRSMRVSLGAMSRPMQAPGMADPEAVKKLAALGYISVTAPNLTEKDLPDPKDRIHTLDRLRDAGTLLVQHRDEEAVAVLRAATAENPRMLDTWETLTRTLRKMGRVKEAREALREADRLSPATVQILLGLCDLSVELKDFRNARIYLEAARAVGATNIEPELAAIALGEGDLATARREALGAREKRPSSRAPLLQLARIEQQGGNLPRALDYLDEALRLGASGDQRPIFNLQAIRADVLAHMGREREAEEAFRAELKDFPENLDAWQRLAFLYASQARAKDFRALLEEMTSRLPTSGSFEAAAKVSEVVGDRRGALEWSRRTHERFRKGG
ncbi:MAG TPA: sulfatase-like hydrolase/transferase [Thermoanaerobaculia bacterium]